MEETGTLTLPISPHLLKASTKGKLATRSIPVIEDLRQLLTNYYPIRGDVYLFPGRSNGHLAEDSAARILREACKQVGIIGVSTHSFRRTALTQMSNAGIPLRVIQEISGHRNLEQLQKYMEVSDSQSSYTAMRSARKRLQQLEGEYPCATWLPVICTNPAEPPMVWQVKHTESVDISDRVATSSTREKSTTRPFGRLIHFMTNAIGNPKVQKFTQMKFYKNWFFATRV